MSNERKLIRCEEVAPLLVFYTCDELSAEEREQIVAHLANCSECSAQLCVEDSLQQAIESLPQTADQFDTAGVLLSQCRSELAESLDELAAPKVEEERWQFVTWVRKCMALRPGWSAAALMLVGAIVGTQAFQWLPFNAVGTPGSPVNVLAASKIPEDKLDKMQISNVNFSRSTGKVQLQLQAEQPLTLTSDEDPTDMRRVLTFVVASGDRFDADIRLNCVEALRVAAATDEQTRDALLAAARRDQNPAVRLKALDALRDMVALASVRDALLDRLEHDPNPGVRVEAVNLLVRSIESGDETSEAAPEIPSVDFAGQGLPPQPPQSNRDSQQRILRALDELRQHDSNRYVRLRSAAALRQIALQEVQ